MIACDKIFLKSTANKRFKSGIEIQIYDKEHLKSNLMVTLTKAYEQVNYRKTESKESKKNIGQWWSSLVIKWGKHIKIKHHFTTVLLSKKYIYKKIPMFVRN